MDKALPESLTLEEQLIVYGWFYKLGSPLISDKRYNALYKRLRLENPNSIVVTKTWSEIEEPYELLVKANQIGLSNELKKQNSNGEVGEVFFMPKENMLLRYEHYQETKEYFDQFIPKSIDTIESLEDSSEWLNQMKGSNKSVWMNGSIKIDGWFTDIYYYEGYYIGGHTRGRADGEHRDVSIALSHVMPMKIPTDEKYVKISCESAMLKSSLEILRKIDSSREWKNTRNSMSTLLLNTIPKEWYQYIVPFGLSIKGIEFDSAMDMFLFMKDCGIDPTPNVTIEVTSNDDLINFIQKIGSLTTDIPSDGIVIQVDNRTEYNLHETSGKYDDAIRAYRMFEWESNIYISMVTGFSESYSAHNISLGLEILPVTISNNRTVTDLDADNLDRILRSGVSKGSLVAFQTRSDSYVDWIDFSTMYIDKCTKYDIPMEPKFAQALSAFRKTLEDKMGTSLSEMISGEVKFIE